MREVRIDREGREDREREGRREGGQWERHPHTHIERNR